MKPIDVSDGEARDMLSVEMSHDIINFIEQDASCEESMAGIFGKILHAYPTKSKFWVFSNRFYRDRTFSVIFNGFDVGGGILEPEDDFLECLESCLEEVLERHYQQILVAESRLGRKKRLLPKWVRFPGRSSK